MVKILPNVFLRHDAGPTSPRTTVQEHLLDGVVRSVSGANAEER